jgi:hypothetical protein
MNPQNELIAYILDDIEDKILSIDVILEKNLVEENYKPVLLAQKEGLAIANRIVGSYYVEEADNQGDW